MSKNINTTRQSGFALLVIIMMGAIGLLLMMGLLSIAERNSAVISTNMATQSAANAGAYTYAQTYLQELQVCTRKEIQDQLGETQGVKFETCRANGLQKCVDTDFEECELDLYSCWDDGDTPMQLCQADDRHHLTALSAAKVSARKILHKHKIEEKFVMDMDGDLFNISFESMHNSKFYTFGRSGKISAHAESKSVIVAK